MRGVVSIGLAVVCEQNHLAERFRLHLVKLASFLMAFDEVIVLAGVIFIVLPTIILILNFKAYFGKNICYRFTTEK